MGYDEGLSEDNTDNPGALREVCSIKMEFARRHEACSKAWLSTLWISQLQRCLLSPPTPLRIGWSHITKQ